MKFSGTFCLNAKMSSHLNVGFKHLSVTSYLRVILPSPDVCQFHAVFEKKWPNNRLAPHLWVWRHPPTPPLGNLRSTSDTNSLSRLRQTDHRSTRTHQSKRLLSNHLIKQVKHSTSDLLRSLFTICLERFSIRLGFICAGGESIGQD